MIYVMSPTGVATGGTELLQQLCYTLNQQNIEAKMYYIGEYKGSPGFEPGRNRQLGTS